MQIQLMMEIGICPRRFGQYDTRREVDPARLAKIPELSWARRRDPRLLSWVQPRAAVAHAWSV